MAVSTGRSWATEVCNPWPGVLDNAPASRSYAGGFGNDLMRPNLPILHRRDRLTGFTLQTIDLLLDLLGGFCGAACKMADFIGDDGETTALFARAGSLDGRIQGQQIGLFGNAPNHLKNGADALGMLIQCGNDGRGFGDLFSQERHRMPC